MARRIHDARFDSWPMLVVRIAAFVVASIVAFVLLREAGEMLGDPRSALARYRTPAVMPHVFVQGKLQHREGGDPNLPPLCTVDHEQWTSCGKNHCWRRVEGFSYSDARVEITKSSGPLPSSMDLASTFHFEPWEPPRSTLEWDSAEDERWRTYAKKHALGFDSLEPRGDNRLATSCAKDGDPVFLEACVSPTKPGLLEPCPGHARYGFVWKGDAEAAVDDAADGVAGHVGGAALALLVAVLAWFKRPRPILSALEDRAVPHKKTLGLIWALLGVPPILILSVVFMHGAYPPSTWATGRGGFAFALSVLTAWLFFALTRWHHRRRTLFALAPVLSTPRSLLSEASGTVELAVEARGNTLRSFIGDEPVAYSEILITETFRKGRSTSTQQVYRGRQSDSLKVVDESGDGVLDLASSVLDVEQRTITMPQLSPRYFERGVVAMMDVHHVSYTVCEWVIKDGEPLYVFGDVSGIALQASEGGYRSVRGSPTLGGQDAAPVLVHSGDERGLIDVLSREARSANGFAAIAALLCTGIAAALAVLSRF